MKNLKVKTFIGFCLTFLFLINLFVVIAALIFGGWMWVTGAILLSIGQLALWDAYQKKHTILRNFPIVGRFRYLIESFRPKFIQYFEGELEGRPFNRRQRSVIYQRAKNVRDTVAFGMQSDPYSPGHEWIAHSIYPVKIKNPNLRVIVGLSNCRQPYDLSILNIGAMSYGALSKTAVQSLSEGAKKGGFAINTGEGGISPYHIEGGGDIIWQIGTGYFGCRTTEGKFDPILFRQNAGNPQVKMVELKLSQGAKPGHGGILPAIKNTNEIAAIRNVVPGVTVYSPGHHSAFSNAVEMLSFIDYLKLLSDYKPVGIKLCIGNKSEFEDLCAAMKKTNIYPDFITIDGSEGGTGAAPLEFTDHVGMPLLEALAFTSEMKRKYRIPSTVIASGRIITAFDILKAIAMGAEACYSARGMMMALGCIQALICDSGNCPVGITTQNKRLYRGIDIGDKRVRIANYHKNTLSAVVELMEACGYKSTSEVEARDFNRRLNRHQSMSLQDIYFSGVDLHSRDNSSRYTYLN
ncbi:MAG: FMN-binding glutamate synthase family protein [Bacteroidota bacterium]